MDAYEKILEPYQIQNGGNLIVMQIENEFEIVSPSTIHYMQVSILLSLNIILFIPVCFVISGREYVLTHKYRA